MRYLDILKNRNVKKYPTSCDCDYSVFSDYLSNIKNIVTHNHNNHNNHTHREVKIKNITTADPLKETALYSGYTGRLVDINDIDLVELQRKYRPKPAKSIKSSWQELQVSNKVKLRTLEEGVQVNLFPKQNLTHKAPCPKCAEDNYIYWFDYSDEKQKKLGCVKCETRIDVHQAYEVN